MRTFLVLLISAVCSGGTLRAQVTVTPTVTFDATLSLYSYSYSVTNLTALDLAIVTLPIFPAAPSTIMNLSAPTGFGALYDFVLGLLSFFEDNNPATPQTFAPGSTVSGFAFLSPSSPGTAVFEALDEDGNSHTGATMAPVPEPSTTLLLGIALSALCFSAVRRRK